MYTIHIIIKCLAESCERGLGGRAHVMRIRTHARATSNCTNCNIRCCFHCFPRILILARSARHCIYLYLISSSSPPTRRIGQPVYNNIIYVYYRCRLIERLSNIYNASSSYFRRRNKDFFFFYYSLSVSRSGLRSIYIICIKIWWKKITILYYVILRSYFGSRRDARKLIIMPGKRVICLEIKIYVILSWKTDLTKIDFHVWLCNNTRVTHI